MGVQILFVPSNSGVGKGVVDSEILTEVDSRQKSKPLAL